MLFNHYNLILSLSIYFKLIKWLNQAVEIPRFSLFSHCIGKYATSIPFSLILFTSDFALISMIIKGSSLNFL